MENIAYILLPFISAAIGWFTNFLAVKMMFRPYKPLRILGITIQGLIPRRQHEMAISIGKTVENELISHRDIEAILAKKEVHGDIHRVIEEQLDLFLKEKLSSNPMISLFVQGPMGETIKTTLLDHMEKELPTYIELLVEALERHMDFSTIVAEKIEGFDLSRLEDIIYEISAKELKMIEVLGGVLGFIIGALQVGLIFLLQ